MFDPGSTCAVRVVEGWVLRASGLLKSLILAGLVGLLRVADFAFKGRVAHLLNSHILLLARGFALLRWFIKPTFPGFLNIMYKSLKW